jgi:hypothetical protein
MPFNPNLRHDDADTRPVTVERSDVIDAAGALVLMARDYRQQARSRANAGPHNAGYREGLRHTANVYEAVGYRLQKAADESDRPTPELICDGTYTNHHPTAAGNTCRRCGATL